MPTAEARFRRELELFRTEEESATQFFYAFLAIHSVAADKKEVHSLLDTAPLFWNTCAGALQMAALVALGRVFDQHSPHNLDQLLRIAQDNPDIFSKAALSRRKQEGSSTWRDWLDDYLASVYEPTPEDFRRIRAHVKKRRRVYEKNYRDVRHKYFAHREVGDRAEVEALFQKCNVLEMQKLFTFLGQLHEALWELFENGRKPILRPTRYSARRIRSLPSRYVSSAQERIVREAEQFLVKAVK